MTTTTSGLEARVTPDGDEVYVDTGTSERGDVAPFHPVYADPTGHDRLGFFCANCESYDSTMDTMGRIECPGCGNTRLPTRWDAAYL